MITINLPVNVLHGDNTACNIAIMINPDNYLDNNLLIDWDTIPLKIDHKYLFNKLKPQLLKYGFSQFSIDSLIYYNRKINCDFLANEIMQ